MGEGGEPPSGNYDPREAVILLGDGKGSFRSAPGPPFDVHSHPHPHGVAVADFDGDGKPDVVTDSWGENKIELLLGKGDGSYGPPVHFATANSA